MTSKNIHIIPYNESMHDEVMQMERGITQGTDIELEIIKKSFTSRAVVFKNYYSNIALNGSTIPAGAAIGSVVPLTVNGEIFNAGFGFDAKVIDSMRKKGIGKMLAKDLYKNFFRPNGMSKCFMTAKLTNAPILKVVNKFLDKIWLYPFAYLTIPTNTRISDNPVSQKKPEFSVCLYKEDLLNTDYYTDQENGLGYFHTWKLYTLRIKKVSWIFKTGIRFLKLVNKSKYKSMPAEGDTFSFATLFNHGPENISHINEVLEDLEKMNIKYLLVCCRKNDSIYNYLRKWSINTYKYYIVSDFSLDPHDSVSIDVRCL